MASSSPALTETIRKKNRAHFLLPSPPSHSLHSQRGESTHNYDIKGYSVAQSHPPGTSAAEESAGKVCCLSGTRTIVGTTGQFFDISICCLPSEKGFKSLD